MSWVEHAARIRETREQLGLKQENHMFGRPPAHKPQWRQPLVATNQLDTPDRRENVERSARHPRQREFAAPSWKDGLDLSVLESREKPGSCEEGSIEPQSLEEPTESRVLETQSPNLPSRQLVAQVPPVGSNEYRDILVDIEHRVETAAYIGPLDSLVSKWFSDTMLPAATDDVAAAADDKSSDHIRECDRYRGPGMTRWASARPVVATGSPVRRSRICKVTTMRRVEAPGVQHTNLSEQNKPAATPSVSQAPTTTTSRGNCGSCGQPVLVTQRRYRGHTGVYFHNDCEQQPTTQTSKTIRSEGSTDFFEQLPDELLLTTLRFVGHRGLLICARVSQRFRRVSFDRTLWSDADLSGMSLCSSLLAVVGERAGPVVLLSKSSGVSSSGILRLLRGCGTGLRTLDLLACQTVTDASLRHISQLCPSLQVLDVSWCNVSDDGIQLLVSGCITQITTLRLRGCSMLTDKAIGLIRFKFFRTLKLLDIFGCYHVTPDEIVRASSPPAVMATLCVAQCTLMNSAALVALAPNAGRFVEIDLRGCVQVSDTGVAALLAESSKNLLVLRLAQCTLLSDEALEGLSRCTRLQEFDIKGCRRITDQGLTSLSIGATQTLRLIDVSATHASDRTVMMLASYHSLEEVRVSQCSQVSAGAVAGLLGSCPRLRRIQMIGCKLSTAELRRIQRLYPKVLVNR